MPFTAKFKRETVRLLDAGERPASEMVIDLVIRRNRLYRGGGGGRPSWWDQESFRFRALGASPRIGIRRPYASSARHWGARLIPPTTRVHVAWGINTEGSRLCG